MSRETGRRPGLPWGHWLTTVKIDDISYFVDEDGRAWSSVRKAFWWGSLGMPNDSSGVFDRDLEHFFGVLTAIDRRRPPRRETVVDMFEGDGDYHRFYLQWLVSVGIMNPRFDVFSARLSRAGREVLMMLAATRPQPLWSVPIGPGSPAALTPSHPPDAARERWFDETDAVAIGLRYRFMRDVVDGKWAIKLLGIFSAGQRRRRRRCGRICSTRRRSATASTIGCASASIDGRRGVGWRMNGVLLS